MKFVRFLLLCFLAVCLLCFTAILLLPRVNEKNIIRLPSKAISEYADFFAAKFSHAYGWVKAACELVHSLLISIVTVCSGIKSRFATPSNPRSQKSKATVLVFVTTISNAECNPGKHRSLWTFSAALFFKRVCCLFFMKELQLIRSDLIGYVFELISPCDVFGLYFLNATVVNNSPDLDSILSKVFIYRFPQFCDCMMMVNQFTIF